jgi:hypothetical protein
VRLTHVILSELIGARRPTVSGALGALERDGHISRNGAAWVLHGAPPGRVETLDAGRDHGEAPATGAHRVAPLASSRRAD